MPELPLLVDMADGMGLIRKDQMMENQALSLFPMQDELIKAVFASDRVTGLQSVLSQIRQTAALVRDRLSQDSWQILSRLNLSDHKAHSLQWVEVSDTYEILHDLLVSLSAFSGLIMENTTRSASWRFLDMGRRLVRAQGHSILCL